MPVKAFVSWSSGKDSAFALCEARRLGLAEVMGVVTTVNERYDRVAMHGVRSELLDRQIAALNLPAIKVLIPSPCTNEVYEARMAEACATIKASGIHHIIFGDLFLADIRAYRERTLAAIGMTPIFPLWGRDTRQLAGDMTAAGNSGTRRSVWREWRISHCSDAGPDVLCTHRRIDRSNRRARRVRLYGRHTRIELSSGWVR
jgi:diphthamide synthase (EF-2-diphthine--ammonia ligase)